MREWSAWISNDICQGGRFLLVWAAEEREPPPVLWGVKAWTPWMSSRRGRLFHFLLRIGRSYDCEKGSEVDHTFWPVLVTYLLHFGLNQCSRKVSLFRQSIKACPEANEVGVFSVPRRRDGDFGGCRVI